MSKIIIVPSMMSFNNGSVTTNQGTYKVVPDYISSPTTITINNGGSYPQTVTLGSNLTATSTSAMVIDPLRDHLDWYGFEGETVWSAFQLSNHMINERLSSMKEFNVMLEECVQDVILVQKFGYESWHLYCRDPADKLAIQGILNKLLPISIRLLKFPEEIEKADWSNFMREVRDWAVATCRDKYRISDSYHSLQGSFRSDSDAALFKLKYTYA